MKTNIACVLILFLLYNITVAQQRSAFEDSLIAYSKCRFESCESLFKNPQNKLTFFYTIEKYQDDTTQLKKIMVELVKHLRKDEEIDFQIVNSLLDIANGRFSNSFVIKDF